MINQSLFAPQLRVFRHLDTRKLSAEFVETIGKSEGSVEWVDANLARDLGWTEEIMGATIGAALVDEHGQFVAQFPGANGFKAAEKARSTARVVFDVQLDDEGTAESDAIPAGFEGLVDSE